MTNFAQPSNCPFLQMFWMTRIFHSFTIHACRKQNRIIERKWIFCSMKWFIQQAQGRTFYCLPHLWERNSFGYSSKLFTLKMPLETKIVNKCSDTFWLIMHCVQTQWVHTPVQTLHEVVSFIHTTLRHLAQRQLNYYLFLWMKQKVVWHWDPKTTITMLYDFTTLANKGDRFINLQSKYWGKPFNRDVKLGLCFC